VWCLAACLCAVATQQQGCRAAPLPFAEAAWCGARVVCGRGLMLAALGNPLWCVASQWLSTRQGMSLTLMPVHHASVPAPHLLRRVQPELAASLRYVSPTDSCCMHHVREWQQQRTTHAPALLAHVASGDGMHHSLCSAHTHAHRQTECSWHRLVLHPTLARSIECRPCTQRARVSADMSAPLLGARP
jgi:hypothetical protein